MREHRYSDTARQLDDELGAELTAHQAEKSARAEAEKDKEEPGAGLDRIAKGKTPLDEVRALIDSSRHKSAEEELREHAVRQKLAAARDRGPKAVAEFLEAAKR